MVLSVILSSVCLLDFLSFVLFQFRQYFPEIYSHLQADNFRGDFIALIFRNGSTDSELANSFKGAWESAGSPKFEIEAYAVPVINVTKLWTHRVLGNFLRSDHTRFWLKELPAIFLSDTGVLCLYKQRFSPVFLTVLLYHIFIFVKRGPMMGNLFL